MTIRSETSSDGQGLTIAVSGRFDFSAHKDFRRSYEDCEKDLKQFTVDLKEATYLDSSALGMLLLLRLMRLNMQNQKVLMLF